MVWQTHYQRFEHQGRVSDIVEYLLEISGDPAGTRTPNLLIRSQLLYPVELRDRNAKGTTDMLSTVLKNSLL